MQYPQLNQLQSYGAVKERKVMLVLFLKPVIDGMQKARVQGKGIKRMHACLDFGLSCDTVLCSPFSMHPLKGTISDDI